MTRTGNLLLSATILTVFGAWAAAREFGPEWEKVTAPGSDYVEYKRTVEVPVVHSRGGNVSNYDLTLESGKLHITETDNQRGLTVSTPHGVFSVSNDEKGQPREYVISIGHIRHFDLNADGRFDALYDSRANDSFILLAGQEVPVRNTKDGFSSHEKRSIDGRTEFVFEDGKWRIQRQLP